MKLKAQEELFRTQNIKALNAARERDIRGIEFMHNEMRGGHDDSTPQVVKTLLETSRQLNYLTKMGGTLLNSLHDPLNIAMAHGMGRTMAKGMLPAFKSFIDHYKGGVSEAEERIINLQRVNVEHAINRVAAELTGALDPMERNTNINAALRRGSVWFSHLTGMSAWTKIVKEAGAATTHDRLLDHAGRGWDQLHLDERIWLANNRIGKAQLEAIQAAHMSLPEAERTVGHANFANTPEWADREAAKRFDSLVATEATRSVIEPGADSKLSLTGTALGKSLFQFQNFMTAFSTKVIGRNAQLRSLGKESQVRFYSTVVGLAAMGAFIEALGTARRDLTITGGSKSGLGALGSVADEWAKNPAQSAYAAFDRGAVPFPLLLQAGAYLDRLGLASPKNVLGHVFRDEKIRSGIPAGTSRLDNVLGPTVAQLNAAVNFAGGVTDDISRWHLPTHNDFRNLRSFIPGQNAPGIQQFLNEGEVLLGDGLGWAPVKH